MKTQKHPAPPVSLTASVPFWKKYTGLLLALLAFVLFANTLGNDYNMDDELVTRHHKLTSKGISSIGKIFKSSYYSDNMGYRYGYRPVGQASFALEHQFFGESPAVSHFFNVLLYALAVFVFFRMLILLLGEEQRTAAILATLLFLVHPIHTEAVASIKNREEILAFLFALSGAVFYLRFLKKEKPVYLLAVLVCFSLAILSKKSIYPLAMVLPVMALLFRVGKDRYVLWGSLALILPAAVGGADANPGQTLILAALPMAGIGFFYLLRQNRPARVSDYLNRVRNSRVTGFLLPVLPLLIFGVIFYFADRYWLYYLFIPGLASLFVLNRFWPRYRYLAVIWGLALVGLRWEWALPVQAALAVYAYLLAKEDLRQKEGKIYGAGFVALAIVSLGSVAHPDWGTPIMGIVFFLFFRSVEKWGWRALAIFTGAVALTAVFAGIKSFHLFVFVSAVLLAVSMYGKRRYELAWLLPVGLLTVGFFAQPVYDRYNGSTAQTLRQNEQAIPGTETLPAPERMKEKSSVLPMEGRKLEFAENTLVAPHTRSQRYATALETLGEYLVLHVFPYELSFYYGYAKITTTDFRAPEVWIFLVLHLVWLAAAIRFMKKSPLLFLGTMWYMLSIFLFSNVSVLVAGMVGERLAFTASAGFCIFCAALLVWAKPHIGLKSAGWPEGVLLLVLVVFGLRTVIRNSDWKDAVTLMGNDISHLENSAQANNLYALNLMQASFDVKKYRPDQQLNLRKLAVKHFDRALQIWPDFFNAAYDKGRSAQMVGDIPAAIDGYEKAAAMKHTDFMDPNYQLSDLYLKTGRYPDFLRNAKAIFEIEHNRPEAYNLVARGFFLNARSDSAKIYLRKGLQQYPTDTGLKNNLAEIFKREGQPDSVAYYLSK